MLIQYNSSCDLLSDENKRSFKNMQIGNLFNAVEGLMSWPENEMNAAARKPYSIQRQAVDMLHLQRWSKEEMLLIEWEMMRVFLYYQKEESNVSNRIIQLSSDNLACSYTMGSIALLKSKSSATSSFVNRLFTEKLYFFTNSCI